MSIKIQDDELDNFFETAIDVARQAGTMILAAFEKEKTIELKDGAADLVTETDQAVEKLAHSIILKKYPNHKFIGEETVATNGEKCKLTDDPTWIIDPIDGTTNFVHRIPDFAFSLGITVNKQPVIGIVYLPVKNEMYSARLGKGAFLNNEKLKATDSTELNESIVVVEAGSSRDPHEVAVKMKNIQTVLANCRGFRSYGAASYNLCCVASGRADAYFEYGIHVWDFVAGVLIAREAGAVAVDPTGSDLELMHRRLLCASSPRLAKQISKILNHLELEHD